MNREWSPVFRLYKYCHNSDKYSDEFCDLICQHWTLIFADQRDRFLMGRVQKIIR